MDRDLTYLSETINFLKRELAYEFDTNISHTMSDDENVSLRDYHDVILGLNELGVQCDDLCNVEDILDFKSDNGTYCLSRTRSEPPAGEGTTIATQYALSILAELEFEASSKRQTRNWVEQQCRNHIDKSTTDLVDWKCIVRILSYLDIDPTSIDRYDEWRSAICSELNSGIDTDGNIDNHVAKTVGDFIIHTDITPAELNQGIERAPHELKRRDGGYSIAERSYSDPKGTLKLVQIADIYENPYLDDDELHAFINKHELPTGGFAQVVEKPPSIEATYYAHRIKSIFGDIKPADDLPKDTLVKAFTSHKNLTLLFKILTVTGRPADDLVEIGHDYLNLYFDNGATNMESLYYALLIADLLEYDIDSRYRDNFGLDSPPNPTEEDAVAVQELYYYVRVCSLLDRPVPNQRQIVSYLENMRDDTGGFETETPVGESVNANLFTTRQALRILLLTSQSVDHKEDLKDWILSHRSPNGGFHVDRDTGHPYERSIQATYWALDSLAVLSQLEGHRT
ncbi:hypothetical protein [Natrinema sp. J7-2]|uniref:prenyltransferase/squalene oxidase repeat-containing protein n=2 Tax=unclassified Natrinema TaxID=2622230 RepID=UPI00165119DA|nr:hypothetical protein [Natrinema sp. J7-2]